MSKYFGYAIKVLSVVFFVVAVAAILYACINISPSEEVPKALQLIGITAAGIRKVVWIVGGVLMVLVFLVCAFGYAYGDSSVASLEANRKAGRLEREVKEMRDQLDRMEATLAALNARGVH